MKITPENAARIRELVGEIRERLDDLTDLCKKAMTRHEYEMFKYNVLAHVQAGISEDYGWVGNQETLEDTAQKAEDDAEADKCKKCGSPLEDGLCTDETCPYSDHEQTEEILENR